MRLRSQHSGLLAACLVPLLFSCAMTRQTRSVEPSGFLGDYSQLRKGEGSHEPQLLYVDRVASFARYNAVIIDSVAFWGVGSKVPAEDRQMLTDALYIALNRNLKASGFATVRRPGPNVLRLRAAITDAQGASRITNAVTTILPQAAAISMLGGMATDTAMHVGEAGLEVDIRDSLTDGRLLAGVDRRVGTKAIQGAFTEWGHVTAAYDRWAADIALKLENVRKAG